MLNCLDFNARRKHLVTNTANSGVVHFNSLGSNMPVFLVGGVPLDHKESLKYLGITAWHSWHALRDRPHVPLWLREAYLVPAGMYASQVWGTEFDKEGKDFSSELQVRYMSFLKGVLGVKRATANWAVLREHGHVPLLFYWLKLAMN
eukprot:scaffold10108_cov20-Tisochrysis_lutea.AAC.1